MYFIAVELDKEEKNPDYLFSKGGKLISDLKILSNQINLDKKIKAEKMINFLEKQMLGFELRTENALKQAEIYELAKRESQYMINILKLEVVSADKFYLEESLTQEEYQQMLTNLNFKEKLNKFLTTKVNELREIGIPESAIQELKEAIRLQIAIAKDEKEKIQQRKLEKMESKRKMLDETARSS